MKKRSFFHYIFLLVFFTTILLHEVKGQQQFVQTVTLGNTRCNGGCSVITAPGLDSNAYAMLLITPVLANGVNLDPHLIGAYYMYQNKWSIFNLDGSNIPIDAKFNVEYFPTINGNSGFVFQLPSSIHATDPAYIDYSSLNNNPTANIRICPVGWFNNGGGLFNKDDVKVQYDASAKKWFIANVNNTPIPSGVSYNVIFSNSPAVTNPNVNNNLNTNPKTLLSGNCNCIIPTALPPNGAASGDLTGTYPNPTVQALQGKPISNNSPVVGQILKWNGSAWEPAADNVGPTATPTATTPPIQTYLKTGTMGATSISNQNGNSVSFLELSHMVPITKRSRLIINALMTINNYDESILIGAQFKLKFEILVNGISKTFVATTVESGASNTSSIGSFMIDVEPGNYNVEFKVSKVGGLNSTKLFVTANQSSVMVIPL